MKTICNGALLGCSRLDKIDLPEAISIGRNAFGGCFGASSICVPNAKTIDFGAFGECSGISHIDISQVESIGEDAFRGCSNLSGVFAPKAHYVGPGAFAACSALTEAFLQLDQASPSSLFEGCSSLTHVELPNVVSADATTFQGCRNLQVINLQAATILSDGIFSPLRSDIFHWVNLQNMLSVPNTLGLTTGGYCAIYNQNMVDLYGEVPAPTSSSKDIYIVGDSQLDMASTYLSTCFSAVSWSEVESMLVVQAVGLQAEAMANLTSLEWCMFPLLTSVSASAFSNCPKLKCVTFGLISPSVAISYAVDWGLPEGCILTCQGGGVVEVGGPSTSSQLISPYPSEESI